MRGTLEEEKIKIWEDAVELSKRIKGVLTMDLENTYMRNWEVTPEMVRDVEERHLKGNK